MTPPRSLAAPVSLPAANEGPAAGTAALVQRTAQAMRSRFGVAASGFCRAPGRVNLIGEHTDYNGGFVLPMAIERGVVVAWSPRDDARLRVLALDAGGAADHFGLNEPIVAGRAGGWTGYVRGMAWALHQRGLPLRGADLVIAGDVPAGAGLSSSAALELAVGHALLQAAGARLDATTLALAAQQAENDFVGCRCGVMDQLVSAAAESGSALLIDCRDLGRRAVPLPADVAVLVAHSRVRRGLVDSAYNERRAACDAAAQVLGLAQLRDATPAQLASAPLSDVAQRRARHVVTENQRVLAAAEALANGDLDGLGLAMAASHRSMRDDFEITVPAIDELVAILGQALRDVGASGGARMTGGGFGGCVVAVAPRSALPALEAAVRRRYRSPEGEPALLFECRAAAGAGPVDP